MRKVVCIGAWQPSRILFTVLRAGPKGRHHNTEINKDVRTDAGYHMKNSILIKDNAATDYHLADKAITPMEGFTHYEEVELDLIKIKVG